MEALTSEFTPPPKDIVQDVDVRKSVRHAGRDSDKRMSKQVYPGSGTKPHVRRSFRTPIQTIPLQVADGRTEKSASRSFAVMPDQEDVFTPRSNIEGFLAAAAMEEPDHTTPDGSQRPVASSSANAVFKIPDQPDGFQAPRVQVSSATASTPGSKFTPRTNIFNLIHYMEDPEQTPTVRNDWLDQPSSETGVPTTKHQEWGQEVSLSPMYLSRTSDDKEDSPCTVKQAFKRSRRSFHIPVSQAVVTLQGAREEISAVDETPVVVNASDSDDADVMARTDVEEAREPGFQDFDGTFDLGSEGGGLAAAVSENLGFFVSEHLTGIQASTLENLDAEVGTSLEGRHLSALEKADAEALSAKLDFFLETGLDIPSCVASGNLDVFVDGEGGNNNLDVVEDDSPAAEGDETLQIAEIGNTMHEALVADKDLMTDEENVNNMLGMDEGAGEENVNNMLGMEAGADEENVNNMLGMEAGAGEENVNNMLGMEAGAGEENVNNMLGMEAGADEENVNNMLGMEAGADEENVNNMLGMEARADEENVNNMLGMDEGAEEENVNNMLGMDEGAGEENVNNMLGMDEGADEENVNNTLGMDEGAEEENVNNMLGMDEGAGEENVNNTLGMDEGADEENVNNTLGMDEGADAVAEESKWVVSKSSRQQLATASEVTAALDALHALDETGHGNGVTSNRLGSDVEEELPSAGGPMDIDANTERNKTCGAKVGDAGENNELGLEIAEEESGVEHEEWRKEKSFGGGRTSLTSKHGKISCSLAPKKMPKHTQEAPAASSSVYDLSENSNSSGEVHITKQRSSTPRKETNNSRSAGRRGIGSARSSKQNINLSRASVSRNRSKLSYSEWKSLQRSKDSTGQTMTSFLDSHYPLSSTPSGRTKKIFHSTKIHHSLHANEDLMMETQMGDSVPNISPIRPVARNQVDKRTGSRLEMLDADTDRDDQDGLEEGSAGIQHRESGFVNQRAQKAGLDEDSTDAAFPGFSPLATPHIDMDKRTQESAAGKKSAQKQLARPQPKSKQKSRKEADETKQPPRKRTKTSSDTALPRRSVKFFAERHSTMKLSKDAIDEIEKVSEIFWDNTFKALETFALHAGRKIVKEEDVVLLMKTQRLIKDTEDLHDGIREFLPMELRSELIPIAKP